MSFTYVTSYTGSNVGTSVTTTVTFNAGDSINVWVYSVTGRTVTVSDNGSNTYTAVDTQADGANTNSCWSFYSINLINSATTLTVNLSASAVVSVVIDRFSGEGAATLNAHATNDQSSPGSGTNAIFASSTSIGGANDRNCAFVYDVNSGTTTAHGTGYSDAYSASTNYHSEYSTGSGKGSFTDSTNGPVDMMMTFSPPAGAVPYDPWPQWSPILAQ